MHTPLDDSPRTAPAAPRPRTPAWPVAAVLDVAVVLLFAALGRRAHALDPVGVLETAWPFLVGLVLGWVAWRLPRAPFALWPQGVALWATTVAAGMALRALTGQGTAPSFVLVTLGVLGALLLGTRLAVRLPARVRRGG
ncbi:DUF3054 domain-containing protein [Kocuria flava]|uniref:DUF3054 domain-containing protein n=1 Tax=Kocuria flava TaxID=446860 RepID=UPI003F1C1431